MKNGAENLDAVISSIVERARPATDVESESLGSCERCGGAFVVDENSPVQRIAEHVCPDITPAPADVSFVIDINRPRRSGGFGYDRDNDDD